MKPALKLALLLTVTAVAGLACVHHYHGPPPGYYAPPPPAANYYHSHYLECGHRVRCHYYRGAHHFRAHYDHVRYWHQHRVPGGYVRCYVTGGYHNY